MGKYHTTVVNLRRMDCNQPWGISLVGGSDVGTPLIITRVGAGTPAEGQVFRGDIITKIGDYDARDVRHEDAETLFRNSGVSIHVVLQRDTSSQQNATGTAPRTGPGMAPLSPLSLSPSTGGVGFPSPGLPYRSPSPAHSYRDVLQRPLGNLPHTVFPTIDGNEVVLKTVHDIKALNAMHKPATEQELECVSNQPYRTTPLVLPGAKPKHESSLTESYLRHHPNPAMRQPPNVLDHDVIMKQRVADSMLQRVMGEDGTVGGKQVVHKQFNSPIGLYSEPNIVNTIKQQTGANAPPKKNVVFDPNRSETYRVLQETEDSGREVAPPVTPRLFTPQHHNRVPPAKKPATIPQQVNETNPYMNSLGEPLDMIHQSGSFKRLMYNVLGQSDY